MARKTPTAPASVGVAWSYLACNAVACVTLALAGVTLGDNSLPAQGAAVLHGVLDSDSPGQVSVDQSQTAFLS